MYDFALDDFFVALLDVALRGPLANVPLATSTSRSSLIYQNTLPVTRMNLARV